MKTVFLDRDGVINPLLDREGRVISPQSAREFEFLPGAREAIREAKDAGFQVVVFTNQPDVGKDWRELDGEELEEMNRELRQAGVDAVYACTHGPMGDSEERSYREDGEIVTCDCRKPQPGLMEQAVEGLEVDVGKSYVVGDSRKDIESARRFEQETGESFAGKLGIGLPSAEASFDNLQATIDHVVEDSE